jgi:hypothetical protein
LRSELVREGRVQAVGQAICLALRIDVAVEDWYRGGAQDAGVRSEGLQARSAFTPFALREAHPHSRGYVLEVSPRL